MSLESILKWSGGASSLRRAFLALAVCASAMCGADVGPVAVFSSDASSATYSGARLPTGAFTIECWFKLDSFPYGESHLVKQYVGGNSGRTILMVARKEGRYLPCLFIGGSYVYGTTAVESGVWHHVAAVREGNLTTARIYVDGVQEGVSTTFPAVAPSENDLQTSGASLYNPQSPGFIRGAVADVRVWSVARTAGEIAALRFDPLGGSESGLLHYWPLRDGKGTTAADLAGGKPGTLTGVSWSWTVADDFPMMRESGAVWAAGDGAWSSSANWLDGIVGASGRLVHFTNSVSAVAVDATAGAGGLIFDTKGALSFSGKALTLDDRAPVRVLSGSVSFANDVALEGSAEFTLKSGTRLAAKRVSGAGPVSFQGGVSSVEDAAGLVGEASVGVGTLEVASDVSAPIRMGRGTLRVASDATLSGTVDRATGSQNSAAVVDVPSGATATFAGEFRKGQGALLKTGAGTMVFAHPGVQTISSGANAFPAPIAVGANGEGPTGGCTGMTIANGRVVIDGEDATNFVCSGRVTVGACTTTTGVETAGELEIRRGALVYEPAHSVSMTIGRNNGSATTAPNGLSSKLVVNGGSLVGVGVLGVGYWDDAFRTFGFSAETTTCRPKVVVSDGLLDVDEIRLAERDGIVATMDVVGGVVKAAGLSIGHSTNTTATLVQTGGRVAVDRLVLGRTPLASAAYRLNGGELAYSQIVCGDRDVAAATLHLNGGVCRPSATAAALSGLPDVRVGSGGARFSPDGASYTIAQDLAHDDSADVDGGLAKLGTNRLVFASTASTYNGPTVVEAGTLQVTGELPASSQLRIASGGVFQAGGGADRTLSVSSVALSDGAAFEFAFAADGASNDRIALGDASGLAGAASFRLLAADGLDFAKDGEYTLFTYGAGTPDVSAFAVQNRVYGKSYSFAAADGVVTVKIGADAAASVWNVDADGAWTAAGNWTSAPGSRAGARARFADATTAPRTVDVSGVTAGGIWFDSPFKYTLAGSGMTLDNDGRAVVLSAAGGQHAVSAPLTSAGDVEVVLAKDAGLALGQVSGADAAVRTKGPGTLTLMRDVAVRKLALDGSTLSASGTNVLSADVESSGDLALSPEKNAHLTVAGRTTAAGNLVKGGASVADLSGGVSVAGRTTVSGGTLVLNESLPGAVTLGRATIHATRDIELSGNFTLDTGDANAAGVVKVDEGVEVALTGRRVSSRGALLKTGKGTLRVANSANQNFIVNANSGSGQVVVGPNGEGPGANCFGMTVADGRVLFDAPDGVTNFVSGSRIAVGSITTTAPGAETTGELEIRSGTLYYNDGTSMTVGRNNGTTTTAPDGLEPKLLVTGGELVMFGTLGVGYWENAAGLNSAVYTCRPWVVVTNGLLQVRSMNLGENGRTWATLDVSGGRFVWTAAADAANAGFRMGVQNAATALARLSGDGVMESTQGGDVVMGVSGTSTCDFHLDGGTLIARNFVKGSAGATANVRFNGGVFRPTTSGQTMAGLSSVAVSTNGAVFDLSRAADFTVAQELRHDDADETDGGVVKRGANALALTAADSTFRGPLAVEEGLLRAVVCSTNALSVAEGATFDALGATAVVGGLAGCGLVTNGVVSVVGRVEPGTNSAGEASLSVERLSVGRGTVWSCDWAIDEAGEPSCPTLTVTKELASSGAGAVDFHCDAENPLPSPFTIVAAECAEGASSPSGLGWWRAVNTGRDFPMSVETKVVGGRLVFTARSGGLTLIFR